MVEIKKLSKSYYGQKIVDNLSLLVPEGTIFGFLGPNGAGKTTTMKMIVGLSSIGKGSIEVGGYDLSITKNRSHIGYMPEDPYFYEHLSAIEFLSFARSLFAKLDSGLARQQVSKLLEMVGLKDAGDKKINHFSKGMKQRLGLAQALVNNPDYLFLDEPLDGLDPIGRQEFKKIFLNLKKQGKTIFFNSHVLSDVEEICDTIGIINQGKLVYAGEVKPFCKGTTLEKRFVDIIANQSSILDARS